MTDAAVDVERRPNDSGGFDASVGIKNVVHEGLANGDFAKSLNARQRAPQRVLLR